MVGGLQYFTLTRPGISFALGPFGLHTRDETLLYRVPAAKTYFEISKGLFWKPCHYCLPLFY